MAKKPLTAMLMHPVVKQEMIRSDHMGTLRRVCTLVDETPFRDLDAIAPHLSGVEVLITSWGCPRINEQILDAAPQLKLIAHLAGSVKGFIDVSAWRRGIRVVNAVAANAVPVAEYTLAAILWSNKHILQLNQFYTQHKENRAPWTSEAPGAGNYGKQVGIISASHVGRLVLQYLQPFDLRALLYDPFITAGEAEQLGAEKTGFAELLSRANVVSLHAPLLAETRHMLGARELSLIADGTTIINTARGQLIDQTALITELANGRLQAILDVTDPEVLPADNPLYDMPNVFLTPHISGSLGTEIERLADLIVAELERFSRGLRLQHQVKREQLSRLA